VIKVCVVSNSVVLSKAIGINLISKGYYVTHVFPHILGNGLDDYNALILDYDGIKKLNGEEVESILDKLSKVNKNILIITSEKSTEKLKNFLLKGVKGIIDSSLNQFEIGEKAYEIIQTFQFQDNDKRKHYRVKVEHGILRIEIGQDKTIEGKIFDISAGGVSAVFNKEEESNMLINNKAYNCKVIFGNIVISTKIFLVRREGTFCGFKFFGLQDRDLKTLSEFIFHSIIEETYGKEVQKSRVS
jgi:hypothetical protein